MTDSRAAAACFAPFVAFAAVSAPLALSPIAAFATEYMTAAEAQQLMFPDATAFTLQPIALTPEQAQRVTAKAGGPVMPARWSVLAAKAGDKLLGYVVVDAVIGKFELINYAVALAPDATIRDVQILSYREAHGGEVRTKAWRQQFSGKSAAAPLSVGNDIANISGATLSCTHLTDGIRRIAAAAQVAWSGAAQPG